MTRRTNGYFILLLLGLVMIGLIAIPAMAETISVTVNGDPVVFQDEQPYLSQDRVMVPVRAPMEQMGATVSWDDNTQSVTLEKDGITAIFTVGEKTYTVNQESKDMDVAPELKNNRVAFPIRYCAEALGAQVEWLEETSTVAITTGQNTPPPEDSTSPETFNLTAQDNGSAVDIKVGDTLIILLDSNATTGYKWVVDPAVDPAVMSVEDVYLPPDSALIGAGGMQQFTLKAKSAGTVNLNLIYRQDWEGGQQGDTFTLTIDITAGTAPSTEPTELTEADNGKTITIGVGERFVVALESNPSTGYSWIFAQEPDPAYVTYSEVQFEPGPAIPGAPGTDRWVFDGVAKGSTNFELNYTRPGSNEIPAKVFSLNIIVE